MPSHIGQKRSRPDDSMQSRRDGLQLDFLAGLRVIENLGTSCPTNHDSKFLRDTPLLDILNFISLLVEIPSPRPDRGDIAVAISANQGHLQLFLAKASGEIPTDNESQNLASFIQTLRDCLGDDACSPDLVTKRFTSLIAQRHLPELFLKLSRIGTVEGRTPKENWERFCGLLPSWQKANPNGERSHGFVTLAKQLFGLVDENLNANGLMFKTMENFYLPTESKPVKKMTASERLYFAKIALESSVRMVNSDFFQDIISKGRFHNMLDPDDGPLPFFSSLNFRGSRGAPDHMFLYETYRRINDVARYFKGLEYVAYVGIPYVVKALGHNGLERFLSRTGGITAQWVVRGRRNLPRTLYWGTRPQDKIRRLLESRKLAIDDFDDEEYDEIVQQEDVTRLWSRDAPVTPVMHPEMLLIRHLEKEHICVLQGSIGMNQPPCWPCFLYMQFLRRFDDPSQRWRMSSTNGRPRGYWMLPPSCHPSLKKKIMCRVEKRVYAAVEEYGFDWREPWAHAC
ncbi:hypothetical protein C0991_011933 [Blastosporella zonata]|nr:hypothetical protein C0991_011933 [Blastosporella zonata]